MKCMIIAALAIVAAVHAKPYGGIGLGRVIDPIGIGSGLGGIGAGGELGLGGLGIGAGIGLGGSHYGSGGGYGHTGYVGENNGYGENGYGGNALNLHHNIGHQESDFDQETHHHQSSGHDIGGLIQAGQGGHSLYGHRNFGAGNQGYGNEYNQGGYIV